MSSNPRVPYEMASDRRRLPPPRPGKPLIVHVVVNVEYWPFDQPMPRKLIPGPHGNEKIPDVQKVMDGGIDPFITAYLKLSGNGATAR